MTSRATRIYVRVTRFSRESSVEARNRNAGYAVGSRIAEWQEGKKSAEDARSRRVERTSSIHDIVELPQRARAAVGVGKTTEFVIHYSHVSPTPTAARALCGSSAISWIELVRSTLLDLASSADFLPSCHSAIRDPTAYPALRFRASTLLSREKRVTLT